MTFERFSDYAKCIAGAAVVAHLLFSILLMTLLLGRADLVAGPFPVALPVAALGGLWGWWLVWRTPPAEYVNCPRCHSRVIKERIDTLPKEP